MDRQTLFQAIDGENGCRRLAEAFYSRVAKDPELRSLFPGKTLRCATEEFSAFLVQFFDGEQRAAQYRWWLSLRESHARFRISEAQRRAWLGHMNSALDSLLIGKEAQAGLRSLFEAASSYVIGSEAPGIENAEISALWQRQVSLDQLMGRIVAGRDAEAVALASQHAGRRSVMVGILARMMETGRPSLVEFALNSLERDMGLSEVRFNGRFLIHFAASCGCLPVLTALLAHEADPNILDRSGHAPLYSAANGGGGSAGRQVVRELVEAGALLDHGGGVTRSTALHAAARRGHLAIAIALMEEGASLEVRDYKGLSPLDRAKNCRKVEVAALLEAFVVKKR